MVDENFLEWPWKWKIPAKLQFFLWKMEMKIMPTNMILANHHVPVGKVCPLCGKGDEPMEYAIFLREVTKITWFTSDQGVKCT